MREKKLKCSVISLVDLAERERIPEELEDQLKFWGIKVNKVNVQLIKSVSCGTKLAH